MITVYWKKQDTETQCGDMALVNQWQNAGHQGTLWIDIYGETESVEKNFLTSLNCHPLAIQDTLRPRHPPKVEHFDEYTFMLYRGIKSVAENLDINTMTIAFFLNDKVLITRHEEKSLGVEIVKESRHFQDLLNSPSKLMCAILNHSTQYYLDAILQIEPDLSELEEQMTIQGDDKLLAHIIGLRTKLRKLRRTFSYHERAAGELLKRSSGFFNLDDDEVRQSLQHVYDKFERLQSLTAMYYDLCSDLTDGYLSLTSHHLNNTMRILTVILLPSLFHWAC